MSDETQNNTTTSEQNEKDETNPLIVGSAASLAAVAAIYAAYTRHRRALAMGAVMPEPAEWLAKNFTLGEAYADHQAKWFGPQDEEVLKFLGAPNHDFAHVILALTGAKTYQADFGAEGHVTAIQAALSRPIGGVEVHESATLLTREGYTEVVKNYAQVTSGLENMIRTLSWIMGEKTGQTMDQVYKTYGYDSGKLANAAHEQGINITTNGLSRSQIENLDQVVDLEAIFKPEEAFVIETLDGRRYVYHLVDKAQTFLPSGSNGVERFNEFQVPSEEDIGGVFDRVRPVLADLQRQIIDVSPTSVDGATLYDLLGAIPARDIHERMNGGTRPLVIPPEAIARAKIAVEEAKRAQLAIEEEKRAQNPDAVPPVEENADATTNRSVSDGEARPLSSLPEIESIDAPHIHKIPGGGAASVLMNGAIGAGVAVAVTALSGEASASTLTAAATHGAISGAVPFGDAAMQAAAGNDDEAAISAQAEGWALAGCAVGTYAGATGGGLTGVLGGPAAPATVPAGAVAGGAVGCAAGGMVTGLVADEVLRGVARYWDGNPNVQPGMIGGLAEAAVTYAQDIGSQLSQICIFDCDAENIAASNVTPLTQPDKLRER